MMNRSNSDEAYVPSMMSFVGLEGSSSQKHHLWEWETNSHHPNTATAIPFAATTATALQNHPFFSNTASTPSFFDCPAPPLLPMNGSFPFYAPQPAVPDHQYHHQMGLIKREDGIAAAAAAAAGRVGLNLGHRTYFSSGGNALTLDRLFARSRGVYSLTHQPPRCQAEGCKADLSGAKHYHRRHKVCEYHSKAAVVVAGGLQQRFCQQCSRFHVLAEFDEAKRSCRKRLADHNRRRRKPQFPAATTAESSTSQNNTTSSGDHHKIKHSQKNTSLNSKSSKAASSLYQGDQMQFQHVAMAADEQEKFSSPSTSTSSSFFHHHNLFSGAGTGESGSSGGGGGNHQLLHLGQAMFEMDFL